MPSLKLSDKSVERLSCTTVGYVEYYDTKLTGFGIRTGPKSKVYFVSGRVGKKQFKHVIGKTIFFDFEAAYNEAYRILKDAANGITPSDRKQQQQQEIKELQAGNTTLKEMFQAYCTTRKKLKQTTKDHYEEKLNCYLPDWMARPLLSITASEVILKHAEVGKKSEAQANHVFRVLRAIFNHAIEMHEEIFTKNPVERLSRAGAWFKNVRRKTYLRHSALPKFFAAVEKHPGMISDYLLCLLFMGCRPDEIASLKISQVYVEDSMLNLDETKTDDNLLLPISQYALKIFQRRIDDAKAAGEQYLFYSRMIKGGHIKDVRITREKVLDGTGISLTPYDMRRTFLTYADELGTSRFVQKRLVGHAIPDDVTDGYKDLTMPRLKQETEKITAYILETGKQKALK